MLQETEKPRKFLIFSQKKDFLIFQEMKTPKRFFIFQEMKLSYISRNGNPKKPFIFQRMELPSQKLKKFVIFWQETPKPES